MAKIDYDNLTKQIVEYVGGVENIKTITHCVTRLRLYLNDRNKAEDEKIKNLPGVLGVVYGNQQYQIILGEHLFPVFDNLEKNYSVQTEAPINENLDENLVSGNEKTVNRALTLMAVQQKMRTAIQAGADTEVSDEEAAQKSMDYVFISYQTKDDSGNSKDVSDDEKAQLKSQAEAIASGLKEGGDLNALAEEQGATVQTLTFDKDTTSPDEDLIKAADALGEGESTDVIETEKGCYVAKVTSLLDRTATDSKKSQIVQERQTKLYDDTVKKWRKKADIKVHKGVWKKVSFQKVSVKMKTETQTPYTDQVQTDDQAQTDN